MMSNPFDYVSSITYNKNDMMTGTENDELAESNYNPYLTNKALSYFPDTLLYANEINVLNHIDNKLQYTFFLNSIRPKKRFSKWVKKQEDIDIEAIKQYYKYSTAKAEAALSLLSPQQINEIKKRLNKGG
jgi:hypothetical protein